MAFGLREVRQAFTGKFGFELEPGHRHPTFILRVGGRVVAKTHVSHGAGRRQVSEGVIAQMARQIGVSGPELRAAIRCTMGGDALVQSDLGWRPSLTRAFAEKLASRKGSRRR